MSNIVKQLFDWLERDARSAHEREIERFLSQAADVADLENRLKQLERR